MCLFICRGRFIPNYYCKKLALFAPNRLVPAGFKNVSPGLFCYYSQVTVSSAVSITFESCLICLSKVTELEKKVILLKSAIFIVQAIWITKCIFFYPRVLLSCTGCPTDMETRSDPILTFLNPLILKSKICF